MSVIFILIACSLILAGGFLIAFLWASKSGQFEDDYTPSVRMLFEEGVQDSSKSLSQNGTQHKSTKSTRTFHRNKKT